MAADALLAKVHKSKMRAEAIWNWTDLAHKSSVGHSDLALAQFRYMPLIILHVCISTSLYLELKLSSIHLNTAWCLSWFVWLHASAEEGGRPAIVKVQNTHIIRLVGQSHAAERAVSVPSSCSLSPRDGSRAIIS